MTRPSSGRSSNAGPASTAVAQREAPATPKQKMETIEAAIMERQADIVMTLAKGLDPDQFVRVALQAITRTPKLLDCTPRSFVMALRDAAELGLMPSGLLGEGYLVPYWNKNTGQNEAQFQAGYLGLVKLARQSGDVLDVEARVVRERDELEIVFGSNGYVIHRPWIEGRSGEGDGGPYQGAWFRAKLRGGEEHVGWMSYAQIEAVRKRSKAADSGPWVTDWEAMARKTVTRNELKWVPRSTLLQRAMERDDIIEGQAERIEAPKPTAAQARLLAKAGVALDDDTGATTPPDDEGRTDASDEQPQPAATVCGAQGLQGEPCVRDAGHDGGHDWS